MLDWTTIVWEYIVACECPVSGLVLPDHGGTVCASDMTTAREYVVRHRLEPGEELYQVRQMTRSDMGDHFGFSA